ncbi:hypothetical protein ACJX0J_022521, partial [Zea mays]
ARLMICAVCLYLLANWILYALEVQGFLRALFLIPAVTIVEVDLHGLGCQIFLRLFSLIQFCCLIGLKEKGEKLQRNKKIGDILVVVPSAYSCGNRLMKNCDLRKTLIWGDKMIHFYGGLSQ